MKKIVNVVGSIIENSEKEILCALRSLNMSMPNLWEFPGGKIEKGEDIKETIIREIQEELGCEIETDEDIFDDYTHEYDNFFVRLITIKCKIIAGEPIPKEHSKLIWLKKENLSSLRWSPADIPTVNKLITSS